MRMIIKSISWIWLWFCVAMCFGQTTAVSVTVTDPSNTAWAGGTFVYVFIPNPNYPGVVPLFNGLPLSSAYTSPTILTLDNTGSTSFTLPQSSTITPIGSSWRYTVCPATLPTTCSIISIPTVGSTQNISSTVNSIISTPGVNGFNVPNAYNATQILSSSLKPGTLYFDYTAAALKYWTGATWTTVGSGGGFPITLGTTSIAGSSTTTSLTGLTIDGVSPTTFGFLDCTSSCQTQLNGKDALGAATAAITALLAAVNTWSANQVIPSISNTTSITGPNSGTGILNLIGGTGTGAVALIQGSSGSTGVAELLGGTTNSSTAILQPTTGLAQSNQRCGIGAGGGISGAQTYCDIKATTDTNGYVNGVRRYSAYNIVGSSNTLVSMFEEGVEGCLLSSNNWNSTCSGSTNTIHKYEWVSTATSGSSGFTTHEFQCPSGAQSSWTNTNCLHIWYTPARFYRGVFGITLAGDNFYNGATLNPTYAAGTGAGTGATTPVCVTGHACNFVSGTVSFTTGTGTSANTVFTVSGLTRTNIPDCLVTFATGTGVYTTGIGSSSVSVMSFFANGSLTASTAYSAIYHCLGQ